jgi:anaerobic magnesium-protoporphyrin IX monomethyl ester cyclase
MIMNGVNNNCEIIFINPALNTMTKPKINSKRVDKSIPNQETPHIGIAYLMSALKMNDISFEYVDLGVKETLEDDFYSYIEEKKPLFIGFSAFTSEIINAAQIATKIKERCPDTYIVVGGPHVIALPLETLEEFECFDYVIFADGEEALVRLISNVKKGLIDKFIPNVVSKYNKKMELSLPENLDDIPFPAWEEFDLSCYGGTYPHRTKLELPMVTGRGCPYKCTFCCRSLGNKMRRRSVSSIIAEIEYNIKTFGCESIAFLDETFISQKKWTDEFLSLMIEKGINKKISWSCSTRVSNMNPDLLKQMNEAGCYYIFFGLESADNNTLKRIKKGITVEQICDAVMWSKQAGIIPVGAFIIGLEGTLEKETHMAIELGKKLDLFSITFPIACPFPGTEIRQLAKENRYGMRILTNDWSLYSKQETCVLESDELSCAKRKEMQSLAYSNFPRQKINDYIARLF